MKKIPTTRWIYPIIIGDMSIGALSPRLWEAICIAVAYLNEVHNLPIRMCTGEGGVPEKAFKIKIFKIYDFTNRIRAFWLEQDYKFNA